MPDEAPETRSPPTRPPARASRAPAIVLLVFLGLALALVLIGAELAKAPAGPPQIAGPGTAASPRDVNVILRDYAFNPDPLYLVPGETVRLHIVNGGLVEHEFVLGDDAVQAAWARADALATPPSEFATAPPASVPAGTGGVRVLVGSGQTVTALYDVPSTGALQLLCHLPGHLEQGMAAQVVLLNR